MGKHDSTRIDSAETFAIKHDSGNQSHVTTTVPEVVCRVRRATPKILTLFIESDGWQRQILVRIPGGAHNGGLPNT
jgi:hypothetical protein